MKGPQRQYTKEMGKHFGYTATWIPGTPLELGDIGVLKDAVFTRVANLSDYQVAFDVREDTTSDYLEYSSEGSVSMTAKVAGTLPPAGSTLTTVDAGFIVEFKNENSVLFKANGIKTNLIKNTVKVGEAVLKLYRDGKWNKHWVVITELVSATSATILISNTQNAKLELKANANVDTSRLDIADATFEFGATFYKGLDTNIVAQEGLTPLFKTKGLKSHIFVPPTFEGKGVTAFDLVTPDTAKNAHRDDIYFA